MMPSIADLLFEAHMLKHLPRSGYRFLGVGRETVAEHSYHTGFIALVMGQLEPGIDPLRLISMCLIHDLPESRIGDLNAVQKRYVTADEDRAVRDAFSPLPFGDQWRELLDEFNAGKTMEARLARDADQIAFLLDLKTLSDLGFRTPEKWQAFVTKRIFTDLGRRIAAAVAERNWDGWWLDHFIDRR